MTNIRIVIEAGPGPFVKYVKMENHKGIINIRRITSWGQQICFLQYVAPEGEVIENVATACSQLLMACSYVTPSGFGRVFGLAGYNNIIPSGFVLIKDLQRGFMVHSLCLPPRGFDVYLDLRDK